jgi:hypothetical protein
MRSAEVLLKNILVAAEEQIKAARTLDVSALAEATARRQDLLFELELEYNSHNIDVTPEFREVRRKLELVDGRLMELLTTVAEATRVSSPTTSPFVYGSNGRIRR